MNLERQFCLVAGLTRRVEIGITKEVALGAHASPPPPPLAEQNPYIWARASPQGEHNTNKAFSGGEKFSSSPSSSSAGYGPGMECKE